MQSLPQNTKITDICLETDNYKGKVLRKIRKLSCYNKKHNYSLITIYHLNLLNESKEVFNNNDLLYNIEFYYNQKGDYPFNTTIVYNNLFRVIAYSEDLRVFCNFEYPVYQNLLDYALKNKIEFLFKINGTNGMIYFCTKGKSINVVIVEIDGIKVLPIDEFVNCCWNILLL